MHIFVCVFCFGHVKELSIVFFTKRIIHSYKKDYLGFEGKWRLVYEEAVRRTNEYRLPGNFETLYGVISLITSSIVFNRTIRNQLVMIINCLQKFK